MIAPTLDPRFLDNRAMPRPLADRAGGETLPEVKTPRLSLMALRREDSHDLMQVFSDKRLMPLSESEARAYIERARQHAGTRLPIFGVHASEDRLIGVVSLGRSSGGQGRLHMFGPTLGVSIAPEFQGRGYGTEAVGALINHAARHGGYRVLHAMHVSDNTVASRLLVRAGFLYTGRRTLESDGQEALHMIRLL